MQEGRWVEAEAALVQVEALRPEDPDVQALLGIARYELGRVDEAVACLRAALRGGTRYEARALYMMGVALSRLGEQDEAEHSFARLLTDHPGAPEANRLREVATPPEATGSRPWRLAIQGTVQRDDNPVRGTQVDDLALAALPADWLSQLALSASYRFAESRAMVHGSIFRMDYREADAFDFTSVAARLDGALRRSARTRVALGYELRSSWLAKDRYETRHEVDLRMTRALGAAWSSSLALNAARKVHPEAAFEDLDGDELGGSLAFVRRGSPGSRLVSNRIALDVARTGARQDYLAHTDAAASSGVSLALPARLALELSVEARRRAFRETDPRFLERREDLRWLASTFVTTPIGPGLRLRLGGTLADNHSTIGRYDYRQLVVGTTVSASL